MRRLLIGVLTFVAVLFGSASVVLSDDAKSLPQTSQFMSMLNTCAAGSKTEFSGDLIGSVRSIYDGERTNGAARLKTESAFMSLLPEDKKLEGYRLYIECIKAIFNDPKAAKAKLQLQFLGEYTKDTPLSKVIEIFGQPQKVKQLYSDGKAVKDGNSFIDEREFIGVNVNFYTVSSRNGINKAVGVFAKADAKQAKIPYMHMGQGNPTKDYYSNGDFSFGEMAALCQDERLSGEHARFRYLVTNSCYFGAPGGYMNYQFVFQPNDKVEKACGPQFDVEQYSAVKCSIFKRMTPVLTIVYFTDPVIAEDLPDFTMEWIYDFAQ